MNFELISWQSRKKKKAKIPKYNIGVTYLLIKGSLWHNIKGKMKSNNLIKEGKS